MWPFLVAIVVAIQCWPFLDAAGRPAGRWRQAGLSKPLWLLLTGLGAVLPFSLGGSVIRTLPYQV